ncbi:MAG: hypothetical protein KKI08_17885 [Armatimonadetes bacterium]|nr:hypothetical protein [Armatimonadota bacterium]
MKKRPSTTTIRHRYDEAKNRMQMAFLAPSLAYFTYYTYDARNMLSALRDPFGQAVYYERDGLGLEIAKRLPNDVTTYHNYDAAGQVTSILDLGPGGLLQSLCYTYDDDGQRTRIVREDDTRIYYYDAAHRLTGEDWLDPNNMHLYAFAEVDLRVP